jgi:hypothetical protein
MVRARMLLHGLQYKICTIPTLQQQRLTNNAATSSVLCKSDHHFLPLHGHNYAAPSVPLITRTTPKSSKETFFSESLEKEEQKRT